MQIWTAVGPFRPLVLMFRGLLALCIVTPLAGLAGGLPSWIAFRCLQGLVSATFAPSKQPDCGS
jgi:hypothetical protein